MQLEESTTETIPHQQFTINYDKSLGSGSFSKVYVATYQKQPFSKKKRMACKVINKDHIIQKVKQSESKNKKLYKQYLISRIDTETKMKKIKHPNIVRLYDFREHKQEIQLFMELCDQGNLQRYIQQKGTLNQIEALPIMKDIIQAACHLYQKNIAHRDIKAENILLTKNRAKLADFGLAKFLVSKDVQSLGTTAGSLLYMAPQLVLEQHPKYSIKCDVWSIGVVMYYILYGYIPWDYTQGIQSLKISLHKPIEFDPYIEVSTKMRNLISRALIFHDEDRISIQQLRNQLKQIYHDRGLVFEHI